jgi:hypothetical protein
VITVTTNNHHRPVLDGYELSDAERSEFDYLDWDAIREGTDSASFFRYRGQVYDLSEFIETAPPDVQGWDAFASDSFFSGIVIRYCQDDINGDSVVVGTVLT